MLSKYLTLLMVVKAYLFSFLVICSSSAIVHTVVADVSSPFESSTGLTEDIKELKVPPFPDHVFFDQSEDILGSSKFLKHHSFQSQPYVANGYFGARIPSLGHGFSYDSSLPESLIEGEDLINGWPLFNKRYAGAFVAEFFNSQQNTTGQNFPWLYQYGWDSVISAIPQWTHLSLAADGFELNPTQPVNTWGMVSNYKQSLSLQNGIVSTSYTWLDKLHVRYKICANRHNFNLGTVTLEVENLTNETISLAVNDTIDFKTSQRCRFVSSRADNGTGIEIVVTPDGISEVFGAIYSNLHLEGNNDLVFEAEEHEMHEMHVSQKVSTKIPPNETYKFVKSVGVYTTDLDPSTLGTAQLVSAAAKEIALSSKSDSSTILHENAWKKVQGRSSFIELPDSALLTLASKASVYHINANMRTGASDLSSALSVSGLSSDSYGGQVFWDTDFWMSMGILPFNPLVSKSLLKYRIHDRKQAIKNIHSPTKTKSSLEGAIYPWTSGRYGNCTATGPCFDYEYHINAAISFSAVQLYLSGAVDENYLESVIYPIVLDAALLFSTYMDFDEHLQQYVSKSLTDPDEFAEYVDNGAYTNAAMSSTIKWAIKVGHHLGKTVPKAFTNIAGHIIVPHSSDDTDLTLEYSCMNSSIAVKQADVIMMTYPFENELISEEAARKNLVYYATKQISTGRAMKFSMFSIVSSAMLDTGCSFESYLVKSTEPFLRGPFAQFSEQSYDKFETNGGTYPAFPFLTAHGGFLQTILMGLLGMRYSHEVKGVRIERFLCFKARSPSLFPNGVTFNEVKYMNVSLSINLKGSSLIISNKIPGTLGYSSRVKIVSFSNENTKEMKTLGYFETAIFRVSPQRKGDINSLTECGLAQFINLSPGAQGDVVDSIHDGDNSTFWQASSGGYAKILINLKKESVLLGGSINWGDTPPRTMELYTLEDIPFDQELPEFDNFIPQQFEMAESRGEKVAYRKVLDEEVNITAPFDPAENKKVQVSLRHNVTTFDFSHPITCSRLLLQFSGTHNPQTKGAKIYNVNLY